MKPKLLYVCGNDGSDMRVSKEVKSLSKEFDVFYVGIGENSEMSFCKEFCSKFFLVPGKLRSPVSLALLCLKILSLRCRNKFHSVHVVDEQVFIIVQPFLLGLHVVLDIFDSIFLKRNKPKNQWLLCKFYTYKYPAVVIVTDESRFELLPDFVKSKSKVLPNVPFFDEDIYATKKEPSESIRLALFGSIAENRGARFVRDLLECSPRFICYAAGWCADEYSESLMKHDRVNYLGVLKQNEANKFVARNADYVVCIYPVNNYNNIYASPNKIYDSFQNRTPLIINRQVLVSKFVEDNNIGIVVESDDSIENICLKLEAGIKNMEFSFPCSKAKENSWDVYERKLLDMHS
jgi:hypothetical protein